MESKELISQLKSLVQLDIDAIHAYDEAIKKIDIEDVKSKLIEFKGDHEIHVQDLSPFIVKLGGEAPEFKPDLKGYLIEGMTFLRSATGTAGALKAMKSNEELTNKTYDKAVDFGFPEDIQIILMKNRDDERRHLEYISKCIDDEVWDREKKVRVA